MLDLLKRVFSKKKKKHCISEGSDHVSFKYRRIPNISPGVYIFQRPFLRGLFLKRLIFGGAYVRREICVSKSIGLACSGKKIYPLLLCFNLYSRANSKYKPPGGPIFGGVNQQTVFCISILGALYLEGLIH